MKLSNFVLFLELVGQLHFYYQQLYLLLLTFNLEMTLFLLPFVAHVRLHTHTESLRSTTMLYPIAHHGSFTASIPLILNGDISNPYRIIELRAILPAGRISVDPDHILLQPVPLQVSVVAQFTVFIEYFTRYVWGAIYFSVIIIVMSITAQWS